MNIIIDGYNLLKQALGRKIITDKERRWFHTRAADYARKKGHTLIIIYDGGTSSRPEIEREGQLTTVYSGYKLTADDVIKSYIDEGALRDLLIVTTDRQLNAYASRANIPSIDSLDFYAFMQERKASALGYKKAAGAAHKLHTDEASTELDVLMQEAASVLMYKEEELKEKHAHKKVSKKERLIEVILKKL